MPDVFTKQKRSEVMSRIRGRGNKDTELALARVLRANGISGWRRHTLVRATVESRWLRVERRKARRWNSQQSTFNSQLAVRPDFVFRKARTAIFVDGCFWHGCPKHATKPKNNRAFWRRKLSANKQRDQIVNRTLRKAGWRVVRIWEHELQKRGVRSPERGTSFVVGRIQQALRCVQ
ncbi:MAG: very short patch repair endonuclease [Verrucomicrobia bacterium]|nr:very short patch repair endonuclease [Verrucomicrobiota bacterium]